MQAAAVNITSLEEFRAVSQESWITPMMEPTDHHLHGGRVINTEETAGERDQHQGAARNTGGAAGTDCGYEAEQDGGPEVNLNTQRYSRRQASDRIVIVMAAPPMLIVAPSGIEIAWVPSSSFRLRQRSRFTGMFAADERVKKAQTPDTRRH